MRTTFIPATSSGLVFWSLNLVQRLSAQVGHFGVPAARLASLVASQAEYAAAQAIVEQTETRSKAATARRNAARDALLADARAAVAIVRVQEDVTDAQMIELGLSVPNGRRQTVPRPDTAPRIAVTAAQGRQVHLTLCDPASGRLRRPRDVAGVTIYLCTGEEHAPDMAQWRPIGNTTRARTAVKLPATLPPGTKYWLTAAYYNARTQHGPTSTPVSGWVQFGGPIELAA